MQREMQPRHEDVSVKVHSMNDGLLPSALTLTAHSPDSPSQPGLIDSLTTFFFNGGIIYFNETHDHKWTT